MVGPVYTLTGSRWAAEDFAQEAFLTAHRVPAVMHPMDPLLREAFLWLAGLVSGGRA